MDINVVFGDFVTKNLAIHCIVEIYKTTEWKE